MSWTSPTAPRHSLFVASRRVCTERVRLVRVSTHSAGCSGMSSERPRRRMSARRLPRTSTRWLRTLSAGTSRICWAALLYQRTTPSSSTATMPVGMEWRRVSASVFWTATSSYRREFSSVVETCSAMIVRFSSWGSSNGTPVERWPAKSQPSRRSRAWSGMITSAPSASSVWLSMSRAAASRIWSRLARQTRWAWIRSQRASGSASLNSRSFVSSRQRMPARSL